MAKKTEEKEIDGAIWSVSQFPATEGLAILTRLIKLAGPAIGAVASGSPGAARALEVGAFVARLVEQLDEAETVALVKRLLKDTRRDGKEILPIFDTEFMGNYLTLFSVLGFVLEVNYSAFLGAVASRTAGPQT